MHFVSACEEIDRSPLEYNALWLDVARSSTLKSMGTRGDDMSSEVAHLCKQCAHAFFLKVTSHTNLLILYWQNSALLKLNLAFFLVQ